MLVARKTCWLDAILARRRRLTFSPGDAGASPLLRSKAARSSAARRCGG